MSHNENQPLINKISLVSDIQVSEQRGVPVIEGHLKTLPSSPGVYRMIDSKGDILYVGKAKNLKNKFTKVYDSDNFEYSWTKIADELHVDSEPRLNSNEGGRAYQRLTNSANMSEEFKTWHRTYNHYDYLLYEEFCV